MNTSKILVVAASCVFLATQASAATLFGIVSGPTVSASSAVLVDPSVTVNSSSSSVYQRGTGVAASASGGVFLTTGWDNLTSEAAAIAGGNFITWSYSSTTAYDLTQAKVAYSRSGTTGITNLAIQIDTGSGFSTVFSDSSISTSTSSGEVNTIDLSAYTNVSNATFRMVGWGATATTATFRFNNNSGVGSAASSPVSFLLEGEPVPEPATMTILAAAGLMAARRRKSR